MKDFSSETILVIIVLVALGLIIGAVTLAGPEMLGMIGDKLKSMFV